MGCDYGQILFIGVKLASVDEMFDEVKEERYGCEHKVDSHKFCPDCGKRSIRTVTKKVPKMELIEDWQYTTEDPVIDGKYYMYYDVEFGKEVYIGVYSRHEYNPGPVMMLDIKNIKYFANKEVHLMRLLDKHKVKIVPNSFGVHVIPYLSC